MAQQQDRTFRGWRELLWPVHSHELRKLLPMLLIFFFITLDYNILRNMKDALLVTAKSSGAEVIPFIKVWVMFPMAVLMTFLYTRLTNWFSQQRVFEIILGGFLGFFALFVLFLYPNRDLIHPHELADALQVSLPQGFKGLVAMFRYWSFTLFYAMSELWGNIVLFVLFWGFANEITRVSEAKRFYSLFGIGANLSGIVSGQVSILVCRRAYNPALPFGQDGWHQSVIILMGIVLLAGFAALLVYRWMNRTILVDSRYYDPEDSLLRTKKTIKMSLRENFRYIFRSRYLTCIMLIVLSYNVVINLVEVVWKHQVRQLYPNPADYNTYMNQVTTLIGIVATLTAAFVSGNAIRRVGWTFTAMIAPTVLLLTSILFFGSFLCKEHIPDALLGWPVLGATPLALVVFFGSMQNCLSRAAKYTVFDSTRELAFVPLSSECKVRGKSAIDGVCTRLGKSGGAFCHQVLLLSFSTITASAPFVAFILCGVILVWLGSTLSLGRQFQELAEPERASHGAVSSKRQREGFSSVGAL